MGGRSRDRSYGDRIRRAKLRLDFAKTQVAKAQREAQAAACEMWSAQMLAYGGPAQPSPTIAQAVDAGYNFLELKCPRCLHQGSVDLTRLHRHRDTELWQLGDSFSCEKCRGQDLWRVRAKMMKLSTMPESHIP